MAELFVGTSGFSYPAWRGVYYPAGLAERDMLAHYSREFRTVEINSTFYRLPSERILGDWADRVPDGFRFALKLTQRLTHVQRLQGVEEPLRRFLDAAGALARRDRLGPILVQLPPTFRVDLERLDAFLQLVPPPFRLALEVRHASWETPETAALLARHRVARCLAETDEGAAPDVVTTDVVYVRLRRERYTPEALRSWRARGDAWRARGLDVYVYLKHDEAGQAALDARAFLTGPGDTGA